MKVFTDVDKWIPVEGIIYAEQSEEIQIIKSNDNHLISAGPGAGKTELLAQKATFLLETNQCPIPRKILALTFKVDAADNIKKRVESRCGKELATRFISSTYDAFFKGMLDQFSNLLLDQYKIASNYNILGKNELEKYYKYKFSNWDTLNRSSKDFYKNKYLTENSLPIIETEYGDKARIMWELLLKGDENMPPKVNFKIIARLVEYLIKENEVIKMLLELTYSHIFLDEFQDTNKEQYCVIKEAFNTSNCVITAVGDKKQRIMKWAGAKKNIFEIFKKDFNAVEKSLLINHRSAPNLLKLQRVIINEMLKTDLEITHDKKWNCDDGISELWKFKNEDDEAVVITKKINELIEKGVRKKDICLLVRQTPYKYCNKIIDELGKKNIQARFEDEYQSLLREKIIMVLLNILKLCLNKRLPDEWKETVDLIKKTRGYTQHSKLESINLLENEVMNMLKEYEKKLLVVTEKMDLKTLICEILSFIGKENIKSIYPQYKNGNYLEEKVQCFMDLLWEDYQKSMDWNSAIEDFMGENSIPIMSIHKSKGLEFNTVIIIGLEDAIFWGFLNNTDEEMCTFFVAVSRAEENLYFTYCQNRSSHIGKTINIRPFYNLLKLSNVVLEIDFLTSFNKTLEEYYTETAITT